MLGNYSIINHTTVIYEFLFMCGKVSRCGLISWSEFRDNKNCFWENPITPVDIKCLYSVAQQWFMCS